MRTKRVAGGDISEGECSFSHITVLSKSEEFTMLSINRFWNPTCFHFSHKVLLRNYTMILNITLIICRTGFVLSNTPVGLKLLPQISICFSNEAVLWIKDQRQLWLGCVHHEDNIDPAVMKINYAIHNFASWMSVLVWMHEIFFVQTPFIFTVVFPDGQC